MCDLVCLPLSFRGVFLRFVHTIVDFSSSFLFSAGSYSIIYDSLLFLLTLWTSHWHKIVCQVNLFKEFCHREPLHSFALVTCIDLQMCPCYSLGFSVQSNSAAFFFFSKVPPSCAFLGSFESLAFYLLSYSLHLKIWNCFLLLTENAKI